MTLLLSVTKYTFKNCIPNDCFVYFRQVVLAVNFNLIFSYFNKLVRVLLQSLIEYCHRCHMSQTQGHEVPVAPKNKIGSQNVNQLV